MSRAADDGDDVDEKIHVRSEDKKIGGQSTAGVQPLMPSILARELEREEIWHGEGKGNGGDRRERERGGKNGDNQDKQEK